MPPTRDPAPQALEAASSRQGESLQHAHIIACASCRKSVCSCLQRLVLLGSGMKALSAPQRGRQRTLDGVVPQAHNLEGCRQHPAAWGHRPLQAQMGKGAAVGLGM